MTQIHYNTSQNKHRVTIDKKYIPKLQLHQHSLLTRKVFSQHNIYQHKSSSLYHLGHHQVLVIFKSSSYSSHLHLDLDHHSIWIIISSRTSLLDHHHRCYLLILLIIGSSTKPVLFHVGCRPSLHVGLFQHFYLINT